MFVSQTYLYLCLNSKTRLSGKRTIPHVTTDRQVPVIINVWRFRFGDKKLTIITPRQRKATSSVAPGTDMSTSRSEASSGNVII
jgi:hypothetical protein